MKSSASRVVLVYLLASFLITVPIHAQTTETEPVGGRSAPRTSHPSQDLKGFNEYEEFQGIVDATNTILKLDSTLGYDFNRYAGIFVGVPLYFVHESATGSSPAFSSNGAGDLYFGLDLYAPSRVVNYSTTVTISTPTGSVSEGFSTGHHTVDWTNRFRRRFGGLAPFAIAGLSNTVPDTDLVTRTFVSLGNLAHFEEGAEYDLSKRVYAGASAYQVLPFGNQQVFSRLNDASHMGRNAAVDRGSGPHDQPSAVGNNLTREDGFDAWVGFAPTRVLRMELGYSRSMSFALNRLSFNVGFNVGRLLRSSR